jgi:DNA-binding transcriptional LysR family regulator
MEIRHLRTFLTVAGLLSFNKAAERLNYAQSSVSAQIQVLEEELGVQLFDRMGRYILLTEPGERLIQYAEKIIDLADETCAEIGGEKEPRGSLIIRIPQSLGTYRLTPVLKEFHERFPTVGLHLTPCAHESVRKDLQKGGIDLAFLLTEFSFSADVEVEALGFESIFLVASPTHRLAKKKRVRTRDLQGETVLLSNVDCSYRRQFERIMQEQEVSPGSTPIFHSVEALKRCIIEGMGVTVLPEMAVSDEIAKGALVPLRWEEGPFEVAVLMIWNKGRWLSPTLGAFMETARRVLKAN